MTIGTKKMFHMKKMFHIMRTAATCALLALGHVHAVHGASAQPARPESPLELLPVDGAVRLIAGDGGNIVVQATRQGVVVVDTGRGRSTDQVLQLISTLSDLPIRYVINTSADPELIGGNAKIAGAGMNLAISQAGGGNWVWLSRIGLSAATIFSHEKAYAHMVADDSGIASDAWPTATFFGSRRALYFGDEPIELFHMPNAYTDGDVVVAFRRSDVIATGNVFSPDRFPMIDLERGGSIEGTLAALNRIVEMAVARFNFQGGTQIVPGHGPICNLADVVEYRNMVTIVRDRVRSFIDQGLDLAAIQMASPALEYAGLYGRNTPDGSAEHFIEVIYRDLSRTR